jgi:hypothetical protein
MRGCNRIRMALRRYLVRGRGLSRCRHVYLVCLAQDETEQKDQTDEQQNTIDEFRNRTDYGPWSSYTSLDSLEGGLAG